MNVSILMLIAIPLFWLAFRVYGRYISRTYGENDATPTPAVAMQDGVDYVPSKPIVVFSHHFASIAGAGPIVGPVAALAFGYLPVWLWILLGGIFIGAVHDYTALFTSIREKGHSMAEVANTVLGRFGFALFIGFTIALLTLVTASFLGLTAVSLTSLVPLDQMNLESGKTLLKTVVVNGVENAKIGGIASTSVIVITLFAPLIGWLVYKRGINVNLGVLLAIVVGAFSIIVGLYFPVSLDAQTWKIILAIYTFLAAGIPVWIILQPRDFTNSFILYGGIAALVIGVFGGGLVGAGLKMPAFAVAEGTAKVGLIWPFLFITVACGAISGFHSLVAGGTVSKQVSKESHARYIGYGGMLLESLLAVGVTLVVAGALTHDHYMSIVYPAAGASNPILAFALSTGIMLNKAIGLPISAGTVFGILMVEGFVVTTLDTAVRLNRYLLEELWSVLFKQVPGFMRSYYFNAGIAVLLMLALGYWGAFNAIWPAFGSANQLMAALTLIAVSVWLAVRNKAYWFTLLPAIFMMATTIFALFRLLFTKYIPTGNVPLIITAVVLLLLSVGVIALAIQRLTTPKSQRLSAQPGGAK